MPKFVLTRWRGVMMTSAFVMMVWAAYFLWSREWNWFVTVLISLTILLGGQLFFESVFRKQFQLYSQQLVNQLEQASRLTLTELPIGVLLYDKAKKVVWHNAFVQKMLNRATVLGRPLTEVFPMLEDLTSSTLRLEDQTYQLTHYPEHKLYIIQDVTQMKTLRERIILERTVLGFLQLDNYDEAGQGLSDQEEAALLSKILNTITTWAKKYDIALKRIDTDKMFLVMNQQTLEQLIQTRFDILDMVREQTRQHKIPLTLSIGITNIDANMVDRSNYAQSALQVALARGGDQAAVQGKERVKFFGGKTNAMEKRTRVRARVISESLGKLIDDSKQVLVMGHRDPDMDALGAAIGMIRFASLHRRPASIVIDRPDISTGRLMKELKHHASLREQLISPADALEVIEEPGTLLILVDTHKPSFVVEPEIMKRAENIVVVDHHRRGEDYVDDAVINYIEPYASSTCELVTELLEYQDELTLDPLESTALLAGIVVDTKNFTARAGSRTFEAASFLRRHGADLFLVQSLLGEDLPALLNRSELLQHTRTIFDHFAIVVGQEDHIYDQITIAQTADALVNLHGIEASFVIARRDDKWISISARSAGKINVQVIMEEMGGGGHLTNAACQLKGNTLKQAEEELLNHLEEYLNNEGEN